MLSTFRTSLPDKRKILIVFSGGLPLLLLLWLKVFSDYLICLLLYAPDFKSQDRNMNSPSLSWYSSFNYSVGISMQCNKTSKCSILIHVCCLSLVQESAAEILSNVRFPLLSAEFLMDRVATEEIIRNNRACM